MSVVGREGLHSWLPQNYFGCVYCLISLSLLISGKSRWTAEVACPVPSQPVWPACWIDTPDRSSSFSSSSIRTVQDAWDIYREELGEVPPDLVLTLGVSISGLMSMVSGSLGARVLLQSGWSDCRGG